MRDIRLTGKEELILQMLIAGREMYGLEMVDASGGMLGRGTVYVLLDRMEDKGFVISRREDRAPGVSGIARRIYTPTGEGRRICREYQNLKARVIGGLLGAAS
jgi:DNA-binding PadR family transcriptional regulator